MSILPENEKLVSEIKLIISKSQRLSKLSSDEEYLFNALNELSGEVLKKMTDRYKNSSTPVNKLREEVLELLNRKRPTVNVLIVEELKDKLSKENNRVFVQYQKPYSLFYPFFVSEKPEIDTKEILKQLSLEITSKLSLTNIKVNIVDFNGSNNYGSDWVWLAIYNDSHPNQRTAKQFFIAIDQNGVLCSFYNRPDDSHIQQQFFLSEELSITSFIDFFYNHCEALISDIYNPQNVKYIGQIFKLSHGVNEITNDEYQLLLNNKKAIIYQYTPAMGVRKISQGDDFEQARIGDLFYLCRSNQKIELIGQFTGPVVPCEIARLGKEDWVERSYRIIAQAGQNNGYQGKQRKWWLPSFNSTFYAINSDELSEAEAELFKPFFNITINEIFAKATLNNVPEKSKPALADPKGYKTYDASAKPVLGLDKIITPVAELLRTMHQEPGQMFGIFGEWGRGKTFFVQHLCEKLGIDYESEQIKANKQHATFHFAKFHAWKYQDSEASWAYLYEVLVKAYYKHRNEAVWNESKGFRSIYYRFRKWKNEVRLLIRLNVIRNGYSDFVYVGLFFVVTILLAIVYDFRIPDNDKLSFVDHTWNLMSTKLGIVSLSIPTISLFRFIYKGYQLGGKGKQIVQRYTARKDFSKALGVQAEVQEEIIHLLKAWFPKKKSRNKKSNDKLILFVDDLDRCDKSKIVSLSDSLRVILEDPEIAQRLIVLLAVDEEKLKNAIANKYDLRPDEKGNYTDNDKKLINNYIDKLFIYAIKLHDLEPEEKEKILYNYTDNEDFKIESRKKEEQSDNSTNEASANTNESVGRNISTEIDNASEEKNEIMDNEKAIIFEEELKQILLHLQTEDVTPRKIRIIFYRFLLAKFVAFHHHIDLTPPLEDFLAEWVTRKSFYYDTEINFPKDLDFSKDEVAIKKILDTIIAY